MDQTEKLHCNCCGSSTVHRLVAEKTVWGWHESRPDDRPDHPEEADWSMDYQLFQCCGCEDITLRHRITDSLAFEPEKPEVHYYPPRVFRRRPKWFADLPSDLMVVLDEVYSALASDSRRLAVMGARSVIDMVLTEKVGSNGSFLQRLDNLEEMGFVGRVNRDQLAAALDVGSAAAHRGHAPSGDDMERVMDIIENVLQAVYALDGVAGQLRRNTPRRFPRQV